MGGWDLFVKHCRAVAGDVVFEGEMPLEILNEHGVYSWETDLLCFYRQWVFRPFTSRELIQGIVMKRVTKFMQDPAMNCQILRLIVDDTTRSNPLKAMEQATRIKDAEKQTDKQIREDLDLPEWQEGEELLKLKKYPANSLFNDDGICENPEPGLDEQGNPIPLVFEPIVSQRMFGSPREVKSNWWAFVVDCIKDNKHHLILPGRTLMFEYRNEFIWEITNTTSKCDLEQTHDHLEAEPSLMYWARLDHQKGLMVHIETNDSDLLAKGFCYAMHPTPHKTLLKRPRLFLHNPLMNHGRGYSTPAKWCDLERFTELLCQRFGMTPVQLVFAFIVGGVDNVNRQWYAPRFGVVDVLFAVKQTFTNMPDPKDHIQFNQIFPYFLRHLYQQDLTKSPKTGKGSKRKNDYQARCDEGDYSTSSSSTSPPNSWLQPVWPKANYIKTDDLGKLLYLENKKRKGGIPVYNPEFYDHTVYAIFATFKSWHNAIFYNTEHVIA
jgi:hypothetical protein